MNLIERARWNINRRQNSCYKEYILTLASVFFPIPLFIQFPVIYNFFIDSEIKDKINCSTAISKILICCFNFFFRQMIHGSQPLGFFWLAFSIVVRYEL